MMSIFRPIIDRLKALFAVAAAQELEGEILSRDAERRADLLRLAQRYQNEGLHGIADHLRKRAEDVSSQQPLAGVLPALEHLAGDNRDGGAVPLLAAPTSEAPESLPAPRKKGGRS